MLRRPSEDALRALGVRAAACYPLVPFANRIAGGQLPVGGRIFALRANFPPERHAAHGVGWQRARQGPQAAESGYMLLQPGTTLAGTVAIAQEEVA